MDLSNIQACYRSWALTVYLDCNATTPVEPEVVEELVRYTVEEFGNAGSRSHEFGTRARRRVEQARGQLARVVDAEASEVVFTSGATEANNIALLGLERHGRETGRTHIVSSQIEHKAVLEPLEELARRGFEVELAPPNPGGFVDPDEIGARLREDTLAVSVMHVNNETGVIQPIDEIADRLANCDALLHVDAAQGFGKELNRLRDRRVDLVSVSGHKLYGPKGIGALICRRRDGRLPPLEPLQFGGGQERGLRPGTVPVALTAALGTAAELALRDQTLRNEANNRLREEALALVGELGGELNGVPGQTLSTTISVSLPGLDSEAAMVALKGVVAVSNGSACTSQSYEPSHVLKAMGLPGDRINGALRLSWSHLGEAPDWDDIRAALAPFISARRQ